MKLVSLNVWGGKLYEPLLEFIREQSADTDVFCFQEVLTNSAGLTDVEDDHYRADLYDRLVEVLPDFAGAFAASTVGRYLSGQLHPGDLAFGTAIFVRKLHRPQFAEELILDLPADSPVGAMHHHKLLQLARITIGDQLLTVSNYHGIWIPDFGKGDTPERLEQSNKIAAALAGEQLQIFCGDLNLDPQTESIKILEQIGANLINKYKITTTRTDLYDRPYSKYADYAFTSAEIAVKSFELPNLPISDHRPILVELELPKPA